MQKPAAWGFFLIYVFTLVFAYFCVALLSGALFVMGISSPGPEASEMIVTGVLGFGFGMVFTVAFAAAPFLPRKKWAWIYTLILVGLGMGSCCWMPFSIYLLIQWVGDDVKQYYNV